ncbi:MAG: RnfABCDGE type electron transport complex subunit B [Treponema sp.]|nr:RnfABCDGE type electron transport complex subunit B [Treponema sp.]
METVIMAVASITIIGTLCALLLSIASKLMAAKVEDFAARLLEVLPGLNCGACGFTGCSAYAAALAEDSSTKHNLCAPGGAEVMRQLSAILGVQEETMVGRIALIHCGGLRLDRREKMRYQGIESCFAARGLFGGKSACGYGCLGYGDCQKVCPADAICLEDGLAHIDPRRCTGCSLCVKACPAALISLEDAKHRTFIACSNLERGAQGRKKCDHCCLGCGRCARECPQKAIVIEDNLAKIIYTACTDCGYCSSICPVSCIQSY